MGYEHRIVISAPFPDELWTALDEALREQHDGFEITALDAETIGLKRLNSQSAWRADVELHREMQSVYALFHTFAGNDRELLLSRLRERIGRFGLACEIEEL